MAQYVISLFFRVAPVWAELILGGVGMVGVDSTR